MSNRASGHLTVPAFWLHYSRYRVVLRDQEWSVESQTGTVEGTYDLDKHKAAQYYADELNHMEWEDAMKAAGRPVA